MRVLLQRVSSASVTVEDEVVAQIGAGLLVLVGVAPTDGEAQVQWMAERLLGLRIFADPTRADGAPGKNMNRSVLDTGGELLVVSQFTLTADTRRGRRPSFTSAAAPQHAEQIYQQLAAALAARAPVQTGRFGADMQVALVNDGPVTFLLERD